MEFQYPKKVTNYNTVVETNSDSDDEDKLHIVEEESVTDAADCEGVPEDDLPTDQTVLPGRSSEREGNAKNCWEDDTTSVEMGCNCDYDSA
ncbi:Zinc finger E-box-binding homeobox 1 [Saguinus oedipus]|uniref:Zinc finger E-box-binding homeobox 1 n=1 Tax=Saguinus oedipus TaxID=9490 RepID=A0ABQ9V724_SAGOE|nr:Zinc finger E-box-binding homeobox 1 [Saguinus oedipus]